MLHRYKKRTLIAIIWQFVCVILLAFTKFLVMKDEHTVASYNGRYFTSIILEASNNSFRKTLNFRHTREKRKS
jgi:hypothetical protein